MNTKFVRSLLVVSIFVAALLAAVRFTPSSSTAEPLVQAQAAPAPAAPAAVLLLDNRAAGETIQLAKVYQAPDFNSPVIDILTPYQPVRILGLNAGGDFYALAAEGWVSARDIHLVSLHARLTSLAQLHREPDASSPVVDVLTPDQDIFLLGRSANGNWVAAFGEMKGYAGWISSSELAMQGTTAVVASLAKAYSRPQEDSEVVDILTPTRQVTLLGRDAGGAWFAIAAGENGAFSGWVRSSDLTLPAGAHSLPKLTRH